LDILTLRPNNFKQKSFLQDFLLATRPVSFFVRLQVPRAFPVHDITLTNGQTKEKLVVKNAEARIMETARSRHGIFFVLISRYPTGAEKEWIEENEEEALNWFDKKYYHVIIVPKEMQNAM
jgi:hypothetical protein